jgi:membrane-associated protease RseP (regulator of RpoE activity)
VFVTPVRRRFQHRYRTHALLFLATMFTASLAGGCHAVSFMDARGEPSAFPLLEIIGLGLSYSIPLIAILAAHEFGHYVYCRKHSVDASLPYFIPAPVPLTGTFGAVIKIRELFPSKKALFDIGVAGPIAGFLALLPFLYFGVSMSVSAHFEPSDGALYLGEPLLFKAVAWLKFGSLPDGADIALHPMGFAAWFGLLATALNLLPFGQLDGGHIVYSLIGRRAVYVSLATLGATLLLTSRAASWWSMAVMMLVMALLVGLGHPRLLDEDTPLDFRRKLVAAFAGLIFLVSFTPVPIEFLVSGG